jgi:hypothetical protein
MPSGQPDLSGAGSSPWDTNGAPSRAEDDGDGAGHDDGGGDGGDGINSQHKSRKQIREEERALRSGRAFDDAAPSSTHSSFYASASAAKVCQPSRAARMRGAASFGGGEEEEGPGGVLRCTIRGRGRTSAG